MRIGIDARMWDEGGVGRYIRNLVKHLNKIDRSNEYILFLRSVDWEDGKWKMDPPADGGRWKIVRTDIQWHSVQEQLAFPSILNREKLDLVHFPYPSVPIFYQGPFVVTIHDLIPYHYPTGHASTLPFPLYWIKQLGYRLVVSQAVKRAKMVIAVSNATKEDIVSSFQVDPEKATVTYEGVDTLFKSKNVKSLNIKDPFFLYVGNSYPHKNLALLLEAFRRLKYQLSISKFYLVGKDGYFYKRLKRKVIEMELEMVALFLGEVTDSELAFLYRNAQALIAPSLIEGFNLPILEAMAQNCLVLASDIPVHREIGGEALIYFNPIDVLDIAEKISSVNLKKWEIFSKQRKLGLKRAEQFSWEKMARETICVYESCLSVR